MKLTAMQQNAVDLMKKGFELGYDSYADMRWLQLGGCGYGGTCIRITKSTFDALLKKKAVSVKKEGYPTTTYQLINH